MNEQSSSDCLLNDLREAVTSGRGNYGLRLLCGLAAREIERLRDLIIAHNDSCQSICGEGKQEAVRCQYRPYFEATGRRCAECPTGWKINI